MRSWFLSLLLGAVALGLVALTPSESQAQFYYQWWRSPYSGYYSYYSYPSLYYGYPTYYSYYYQIPHYHLYRPRFYYPDFTGYYGPAYPIPYGPVNYYGYFGY